jgi:hypothetical protein
MDYRPHMNQIEEAIGEAKAADRIIEGPWFDVVMRRLSEISQRCADELENENPHAVYRKPLYTLHYHEAPPMRLLSLVMIVAAWLGWVMREKQREDGATFSSRDCLRRIGEAFAFGEELSRKNQRP